MLHVPTLRHSSSSKTRRQKRRRIRCGICRPVIRCFRFHLVSALDLEIPNEGGRCGDTQSIYFRQISLFLSPSPSLRSFSTRIPGDAIAASTQEDDMDEGSRALRCETPISSRDTTRRSRGGHSFGPLAKWLILFGRTAGRKKKKKKEKKTKNQLSATASNPSVKRKRTREARDEGVARVRCSWRENGGEGSPGLRGSLSLRTE